TIQLSILTNLSDLGDVGVRDAVPLAVLARLIERLERQNEVIQITVVALDAGLDAILLQSIDHLLGGLDAGALDGQEERQAALHVDHEPAVRLLAARRGLVILPRSWTEIASDALR